MINSTSFTIRKNAGLPAFEKLVKFFLKRTEAGVIKQIICPSFFLQILYVNQYNIRNNSIVWMTALVFT